MKKKVCVFASSSNSLDQSFYNAAYEVGTLLGKNNFDVVYGGSRLGIMYATVSSAKENGSDVIGVMPRIFHDLELSNPDDCSEFYLTEGMRERKAKMDKLSDVVLAMPGGFGTLEEITEMIVQKQLGYNNKPIIFLNTNNFYTKLEAFFDEMIKNSFAKIETKNLYYFANKPQNVIDYINNYENIKCAYSGKF